MPRYEYIAIAGNGKKIKGTLNAESPFAARKQLRMRSIHPSSVTEITSAVESKRALFSVFRRTSKSQLIDFTKQLATLLNSGIKLTEALSVLTMQVSDQRFKTALTEIRDRVVTGESFTDALKDYEDYFDVIFVAMVRVGEVTGTLGESLKTIANFMEKRQRVESKILTAMIYPIVLVFFCLMAIVILTTKVIPPIGRQIIQAGQELPWITQQLMNFSHILTSWRVFVLLGGIAAVFIAMKRFFRTDRGAYMRDKFLFSLPVFGPLIKQRVVARFASTLSTLIGSGLAMAESLRVVADTTGNSLMKRAIQQARERILAGADIATPLRESGVIDPAIAHMVAVGEKSGELETMLRSVSENLESSTDVVIERLSAAVEPLIIIIMAAVIGVIAYATILPILRISAVKM
ncbi:MAG: type II secretion system F family protein [Planctomycetes bacterium]|nr:type II secretion system F family protein [Planctomycetota bacterium]